MAKAYVSHYDHMMEDYGNGCGSSKRNIFELSVQFLTVPSLMLTLGAPETTKKSRQQPQRVAKSEPKRSQALVPGHSSLAYAGKGVDDIFPSPVRMNAITVFLKAAVNMLLKTREEAEGLAKLSLDLEDRIIVNERWVKPLLLPFQEVHKTDAS